MSQHSSIVGGSTAGRLINCPGSWQATMALPKAVDRPSEYADEGTAMHAVMAYLMQARQDGSVTDIHKLAHAMLGHTFYDRALTQEHLDDMIYPALEALAELEQAYGGGFEVAAIEKNVQFPGIPGAFGSCDLIMKNTDIATIVDWKFGSGIPVSAVYDHPEGGAIVNPQLLFYLCAAKHSARHLFRGVKKFVVAIIQPRTDGGEHPSHTVVTAKEIKMFAEDLQKAVELATDHDPPREKGEHCRFAPCKLTCPLWTGPVIELTRLGIVPRTETVTREVTPYAQYLARAKALSDIFAMFSKEVNEQLHAYLTDGGTVPGWALKRKVKQRQWIDPAKVYAALKEIGFKTDDIFQPPQLVTFKVADAAAKRLGVEIPAELRVAPDTHETTVCPADDPSPKVEPALAIEQFRESLKLLKGGAQ